MRRSSRSIAAGCASGSRTWRSASTASRASAASRRAQRNRRELPVISIVGYTNAGKSTLLNALTNAEVLAEDKLFATLDPTSRRLRFPQEREVIITDTVGFIRDLPKDLVAAFRATLEELDDASLLLHVVDAADPARDEQVEAVERILGSLGLMDKPRLMVWNKADLLPAEDVEALLRAQRRRGHQRRRHERGSRPCSPRPTPPCSPRAPPRPSAPCRPPLPRRARRALRSVRAVPHSGSMCTRSPRSAPSTEAALPSRAEISSSPALPTSASSSPGCTAW